MGRTEEQKKKTNNSFDPCQQRIYNELGEMTKFTSTNKYFESKGKAYLQNQRSKTYVELRRFRL